MENVELFHDLFSLLGLRTVTQRHGERIFPAAISSPVWNLQSSGLSFFSGVYKSSLSAFALMETINCLNKVADFILLKKKRVGITLNHLKASCLPLTHVWSRMGISKDGVSTDDRVLS